MNGKVFIIKRYLCNDIKKPMSYHIMELYVTTCRMSQLSGIPITETGKDAILLINMT